MSRGHMSWRVLALQLFRWNRSHELAHQPVQLVVFNQASCGLATKRSTEHARQADYRFTAAGQTRGRGVCADQFALNAEDSSLQREKMDLMGRNSNGHRTRLLQHRKRTTKVKPQGGRRKWRAWYRWKSTGLSGNESRILRRGNEFDVLGRRAMQRFSESCGKNRGQKIDVELQIAIHVAANDHQVAAVLIRSGDQLQA